MRKTKNELGHCVEIYFEIFLGKWGPGLRPRRGWAEPSISKPNARSGACLLRLGCNKAPAPTPTLNSGLTGCARVLPRFALAEGRCSCLVALLGVAGRSTPLERGGRDDEGGSTGGKDFSPV